MGIASGIAGVFKLRPFRKGRFSKTQGELLTEKIGKSVNNALNQGFTKASQKGLSEGAQVKIDGAFDTVATKTADRLVSKITSDINPPFWRRRPLMTLLGGTAAGAAAYNMFSRQPGAVTGGEFKPSASELGRMSADEEFARELDQMHQAGLFDQPQGPQAPQAPTMAAAQGATSEQMPPQTTMQASTAGYGGRVASPAVAMEHGA